MKVVSSYNAQIIGSGAKVFGPTVAVYREAVSYLIDKFSGLYEYFASFDNAKEQSHAAERLIHSTKDNKAVFDFDERFPKMPSYLRRAAIEQALGAVSSWDSNYENWISGGKKGSAPKLEADRRMMPVFYKENMYKPSNDPCEAYVKLYNGKDWVFIAIRLKKTDMDYLRRYWSHVKASAPILEKRYGKYYLRFSFTESQKLDDISDISKIKICAVDLGLNVPAVLCIMDASGTVLARKFLKGGSDKDRINKVLGRIRKHQKMYGPKSVKNFWAYAKRLNQEFAARIGREIADFAYEHGASIIVFEHPGDLSKGRKRFRKQQLHMWAKQRIQKVCEHRAHRLGMRVRRICAWNTSRLAYDGSGKLTRDKNDHTRAEFSTGKKYHADLSASYNIGARFFIREILKTVPKKTRSRLVAEAPECGRRTLCTLSTLWKLQAAMENIAANTA